MRGANTSTAEPRRVSFPRGVWVAVAVFGLLTLGGILAQLVTVNKQLDTNKDQRALIRRQVREALPLVDSATPLVRRTLENLPETERTGRRVERLAAAATPLVHELRRAGLDSSARAVQELAATLLRADAGAAATAARDLALDLLRIGPGETIARTSESAALLPDVLKAQRRALAVQRRSFAVQRRSFAVQRETLAIAQQLLAVAVETEKHADSLDRKLGGPAP
jgi:hypothetical protein